MRQVHIVNVCVEPKGGTKVVRLRTTVYNALHGVEFGIRQILEHAKLDDITSAQVWDREFSAPCNSHSLLSIDVIQKSLTTVHGRARDLRGPVKFGIIPLCKSLLLLIFWVVALVR